MRAVSLSIPFGHYPPVPPDLAAMAKRLALEGWGEANEAKRGHLESFLRAELTLRAPREFRLNPVATAVQKYRVEELERRLNASQPSRLEPIATPGAVASLWARVRWAVAAGWSTVRRAWLEQRARRLAERSAGADALEQEASTWRDQCVIHLMSTYDLEFLRGQQAARRTATVTDDVHTGE
ncbi:MAG: hypothetical protein HOP16_21330 [Acidobacteria bacterium]|nr:hypothetical protein [Acidobacteriota bacterium]